MEEWQDPSVILSWMGVGLLFLLLLLTFIVVLTRLIIRNMVRERLEKSRILLENQQRLTAATLKTQEKERERIAADLHDELIGKLNAVKMASEMGAAVDDFNITQHLETCIATARRISHDLSPPLIEFLTVQEIWEDIVAPYRMSHKVNIYITQSLAIEKSIEFKIQFLRIFQELLMNIHKHANASTITVTYRATFSSLMISVSDNGKGYDPGVHKHGLGLSSIETRVQYLAGKCKARTRLGAGTTVTLLFDSKSGMP